MPLITNNSSLGNLFGGKIATFNFNYQPNSSPSSATITIVSENNRYIEPNLNSRIVLPILGIPMRVVEVQYNDDSDSRTLQVELLDELSFILDKNLILINGVHSTGIGKNEETKEKYPYIEYLGHPKANWRDFAPVKERIKKTKNGILLGSNRTTIEIDELVMNSAGTKAVFMPTQDTPSISLVYDAQERNVKAGSASEDVYDAYEFQLSNGVDIDTYSHTNEWGYTLSDFKKALSSFGILISGLPEYNSDAYFFNNTGTIRSVLSSILSTLGLSFYVDPTNQRIYIVSNVIIDKINRNLEKLYDNSSIYSGATEGTFKKTLKDSTARKLVITTSFETIKKEESGNPAKERPKRKTFYRIKFTELDSGWDDNEIAFLEKMAGIYLTNIDRSLIDTYIYSLSKIQSEDPHDWTQMPDDLKIYGGVFDNKSTMIDKSEIELLNKNPTQDGGEIPYWQTSLRQSTNIDSIQDYYNLFPGFDVENLYGAYQNTKTVVSETETRAGIYAADPPDRLEEWVKSMLWIGFGDYHISAPMSEKRARGYSFIDQAPYKVIGPFASKTLLSDIPELGYINMVATRADKKEMTVADLYEMRNDEEGEDGKDSFGFSKNEARSVVGNNKKAVHFIAYLDIDLYQNIFKEDVANVIKSNAYVLNISSDTNNPEQYILVTSRFGIKFQEIVNTCKELWKYWYIGQATYPEPKDSDTYIRDISPTRTFFYEKMKKDEGGDGQESNPINYTTKGIFTRNSSLKSDEFLNIEIDSFTLANLTTKEAGQEPSLEQAGPFYEITLNYYRPPKRSDFDIMQGLSSISSSVGSNGITTNIGYSSRKYQTIDRNFISKYSNNSINVSPIYNSLQAFIKNK
jgi:hypothetical protein